MLNNHFHLDIQCLTHENLKTVLSQTLCEMENYYKHMELQKTLTIKEPTLFRCLPCPLIPPSTRTHPTFSPSFIVGLFITCKPYYFSKNMLKEVIVQRIKSGTQNSLQRKTIFQNIISTQYYDNEV